MHSARAPHRALLAVLATAVATVLAVGAVGAPPASAATTTPGDFTGYAFDARCAPTQAQMDRWRTTSPFWGAGVYLGGSMVSCPADSQEHLDATWVRRQTAGGWRLLPIWVGPQASCYQPGTPADRIDPDPADSYGSARAQAWREGRLAAERAASLGIATGSTLWYDLEGFDLGDDHCRRSALTFLSRWTERLHGLGYRSGVYSSVASGIHALDYADQASSGSYTMPDRIWYAYANGRADTVIPPKWVRASSWAGDRVHQYALDRSVSFGGVRLDIDWNFMTVGRGSVAPRPPASCGIRIDFPDYQRLRLGSRSAQVKALQCLLRQKRVYDGRVTGRFDRPTYRAVRAYQRSRHVAVSGVVTPTTWTVLLSEGRSPVLKRGSASNDVRRLQRALNVATAADLRVTGVFDAATTTWVGRYQGAVGLPRTGVAAPDTWAALHRGRR